MLLVNLLMVNRTWCFNLVDLPHRLYYYYYYYYYKLCTVNIEKHKNSEQKVTLAQANPGNKHLQAAL